MTDIKQPFVIMLVGLPCSGKSKFVAENMLPNFLEKKIYADVLSSDDIIQYCANVTSNAYTNIYHSVIDEATKTIEARIALSSYMGLNIVLDQYNITRKHRKQRLNLLRNADKYYKVAIVFNDNYNDILERNDTRGDRQLKPSLIKDLSNKYVPVIGEEGFDLILKPQEFIDTFLGDGDEKSA